MAAHLRFRIAASGRGLHAGMIARKLTFGELLDLDGRFPEVWLK